MKLGATDKRFEISEKYWREAAFLNIYGLLEERRKTKITIKAVRSLNCIIYGREREREEEANLCRRVSQ